MICIYPPDCTDFSDNGLGVLTPQSCIVTETLNGEYELTLEHPLDSGGKWMKLCEGCILRAPVPAGMTPQIDISIGILFYRFFFVAIRIFIEAEADEFDISSEFSIFLLFAGELFVTGRPTPPASAWGSHPRIARFPRQRSEASAFPCRKGSRSAGVRFPMPS